MSADACIIYFGLRYQVPPDEIEGLEKRSDIRLGAARRVGLEYYWGNFVGLDENYLLFIGTKLGALGPENDASVDISPIELHDLMDQTKAKLSEAGLSGEPSLHIYWQPDV